MLACRIGYNACVTVTAPANMNRQPNVDLLLAQRLRHRPNCKPTLGRRLMFAGLQQHFEKLTVRNTGSTLVRNS